MYRHGPQEEQRLGGNADSSGEEEPDREGPSLGGNKVKLPGDSEEAKPLTARFDSISHSQGSGGLLSKKPGTRHAKGTHV